MMEEDSETASLLSRSGTPESLASNNNIDPTDFYSDEEDDLDLDESLERTIAGDLETLTDSGSIVNQLELQQQQAWREYVKTKEEGLKSLQALKKKLQSSIDKTEPFVVVWRRARNLQDQAHTAAGKFERAHSEYESAKETLRIAEEGIANLERERNESMRDERAKSPGCQIDEAWQETLANATERVEKTSQNRLECEIEHRRVTVEFQKCQEEFKTMENRLKRSIKKSRPYYEARFKCNQKLLEIKKRIQELDKRLSQHKSLYKKTMKHLESLNYLLHDHKDRRRRSQSVLESTSEPNLEMRRAQTPEFFVNLPPRVAITPDLRKKQAVSNLSFNLRGSSGSIPTVQQSKATAQVTVTCSSPEQTEQRHQEVSTLVSESLSKALKRLDREDDEKRHASTNAPPTVVVATEEEEKIENGIGKLNDGGGLNIPEVTVIVSESTSIDSESHQTVVDPSLETTSNDHDNPTEESTDGVGCGSETKTSLSLGENSNGLSNTPMVVAAECSSNARLKTKEEEQSCDKVRVETNHDCSNHDDTTDTDIASTTDTTATATTTYTLTSSNQDQQEHQQSTDTTVTKGNVERNSSSTPPTAHHHSNSTTINHSGGNSPGLSSRFNITY